MQDIFARLHPLFPDGFSEYLNTRHAAVFGLGGVGGYAAEALARSGVGRITLVDADTVDVSNINRQLIAFPDTVGQEKTVLMKDRLLRLRKDLTVHARSVFFLPETAAEFDFSTYDYVCDAVDTVSAKLALARCCRDADTPIISCMGTAGKLHPERLKVSDIYDTSVCPLARVMRRELKKAGITGLAAVWSDEEPRQAPVFHSADGKNTPGSAVFVPAAAGFLMASRVIQDFEKEYIKRMEL